MNDPVIIFMPTLIWLALCLVVGRVAMALHRPPAVWTLVALVISPLAAFGLLYLAGDKRATAAQQVKEEQVRQQYPGREDVHEIALNQMECPHCKAPMNPYTKEGLHSPTAEPWLLICDQCTGAIEPDC